MLVASHISLSVQPYQISPSSVSCKCCPSSLLQFLSGSHSSVFPHSSSFNSTFKRKVITYKVAKSVSFKPNEPRSLTVFHIRITKQKIKESSNGRIGQHQVIEFNDKLNGYPIKTSKKNKVYHTQSAQTKDNRCLSPFTDTTMSTKARGLVYHTQSA